MKNFLLLFVLLSSCYSPRIPLSHTPVLIDTTKYTDVIIVNESDLDSVQVFVTLQQGENVIGLFGITEYNPYPRCTYTYKDSLGNILDSLGPCQNQGVFWAKKGIEYHLNDTLSVYGAIVTFGTYNQACQAAIQNGWETGVNSFEFTVNSWWQNGKVIGGNESFDITLVDGVNSILNQSVTSFGKREIGLVENFGSFWDYGLSDSKGNFIPFTESQNKWSIEENSNIPGVFPHGCDWCYRQYSPPPTCFPVKCSNEYEINTCQTNRPGQGGIVTVKFLGFVPEILK